MTIFVLCKISVIGRILAGHCTFCSLSIMPYYFSGLTAFLQKPKPVGLILAVENKEEFVIKNMTIWISERKIRIHYSALLWGGPGEDGRWCGVRSGGI